MTQWRDLVSKIDRTMIPEKILLSVFFNKVRKFPGIRWEVEMFERAPDNSPQKTYKYLTEAMDAHIERDTRNRFMVQRECIENVIVESWSGLAVS